MSVMPKATDYSFLMYGNMITDKPRMESYAMALKQAITPGCVVLDIGAGTGIFSLLACQYGAAEVHAVEPSNAISLGSTLAEANGYQDRITFHQMLSTGLALERPADVIISDLRSILPLFQQHIPSIIDARERLLAPGGVLIPQSDRLYVSLVQAPEIYWQYEAPWLRNDYQIDLSAGHQRVVNSWIKANIKEEQLLVPAQNFATLDYMNITTPNIASNVKWTVPRSGVSHGLLFWFDATIGKDACFSNAPGQPSQIYGQAFFPFTHPVSLVTGDEVSVDIRADLTGNDYTWSWHTRIHTSGKSEELKADFNQSTFLGTPLSLKSLRPNDMDHVPKLNEEGGVDCFILGLIDGKKSTVEIADALRVKFPDRFTSTQIAVGRISELVNRYG